MTSGKYEPFEISITGAGRGITVAVWPSVFAVLDEGVHKIKAAHYQKKNFFLSSGMVDGCLFQEKNNDLAMFFCLLFFNFRKIHQKLFLFCRFH